MARDFTSTELVTSVKRRALLPTNQSTFTADRIVAMADEEMRSRLVPLILALEGEHLVGYSDVTLTDAESGGIVPSAAIGGRLRDAVLVDSAGDHIDDLAQISLDRWHRGERGFRIEANSIVLSPGGFRVGDVLRLYYHRRPNRLVVAATRAAQVLSIDSGTGVVTMTGTLPTVFVQGATVCAVNDEPPFQERFSSRALTAVSSPTVTLASVADLAVGDWMALEGESPIPQLPAEAWDVLVQAVTVKMLRALGDRAGMAEAWQEYLVLADNLTNTLAPRVDSEPRKVIGSDVLGDWVGDGRADWGQWGSD